MAKVATPAELPPLPGPTTGRWVWRDADGGGQPSLEFVSNNPNFDRQDKRRKQKDHGKGRDRVASSVARSHGVGRGRGQNRASTSKSPHPIKKDNQENLYITLEDVKGVAIDMMTDGDQFQIPPAFDSLRGTPQFDHFLMHLLSYFGCFFEKMNQENKKNPMYIEPSLSEKRAYADACARLEVAQRLLGQAYLVLVLGLGLEEQHHMGCGLSRVSSTYKDRNMFEIFYTFCTFVVWITFRRKEFDIVKKEIGRMLRSDTFNPAIRVKYAPQETKEGQQKSGTKKEEKEEENTIPEKKLTPAEYRRLHPRRPAIKSIINQRSPAIVSILPSPKEEAHWLFKRNRPLSPTNQNRDEEDEEEEREMLASLRINTRKFKIGIIGEAASGFNKMTLTPLGTENEEEDADAGEGQSKELPPDGEADQSSLPGFKIIYKKSASYKYKSLLQRLRQDGGLSRQQTAISHVTTEVNEDD